MSETLSNAKWLAGQQMREQWPSYLVTAAYFAFMGAVLAVDESYTREFAHPVLMLILIQPALASRYMTWKRDNDVVRHQVFLRSLPLPLRTTIVARLIAMLSAGVVNVPIYFGMMWFLGDFGLTLSQFFCWAIFWVGIAFLGSGIRLVQEFWLNMRSWTELNATFVVSILLLIPVLIGLADFRPFNDSISVAASHPVLMSAIGLVLGLVGPLAGVLIAERFYRKREFVT